MSSIRVCIASVCYSSSFSLTTFLHKPRSNTHSCTAQLRSTTINEPRSNTHTHTHHRPSYLPDPSTLFSDSDDDFNPIQSISKSSHRTTHAPDPDQPSTSAAAYPPQSPVRAPQAFSATAEAVITPPRSPRTALPPPSPTQPAASRMQHASESSEPTHSSHQPPVVRPPPFSKFRVFGAQPDAAMVGLFAVIFAV